MTIPKSRKAGNEEKMSAPNPPATVSPDTGVALIEEVGAIVMAKGRRMLERRRMTSWSSSEISWSQWKHRRKDEQGE